MQKFAKKVAVLAALTFMITGLFGMAQHADAYTVEQNRIQMTYPISTWRNTMRGITLHESGNPNNVGSNSLDNEVAFMKRNWQNANAHYFVGGGGRVVQLMDENQYGFHAYDWANSNTIGIELARTNNAETFKKDYAAYVTLARDIATRRGIPKTLDAQNYVGIKSHLWISNNIAGDHTDPYGYLASWGITKSQLAHDLANGVTSGQVDPEPEKPITPPKPEETTLKPGAKVTVKKAVQYGTNAPFYASGVYDVIQVDGMRVVIGKGNVVTAAVHASNLQYGTEPVKPETPKPNPTPPANTSGTYKFTVNTNIRTGTSTSHRIVGMYNAGETVNYDKKIVANGYTWLQYTSYYGETLYVAVVNGNVTTTPVPQSGRRVVTGTTNIRTGPGTGYPIAGQYYAGEAFNYDKTVVANGYTWFSYISYSGYRMYVAKV